MTVVQEKCYYRVTALKIKGLREGAAWLVETCPGKELISFLPLLSLSIVPTRNPATSERNFPRVSEEGKTRERAQADSDRHGHQADGNQGPAAVRAEEQGGAPEAGAAAEGAEGVPGAGCSVGPRKNKNGVFDRGPLGHFEFSLESNKNSLH